MFPNRGETALRNALEACNGDVAAAAERLLPPPAQILRDEALARHLQAAEMPAARAEPDGWSAVTQPVLDGLAAAADAAKAAVSYVAAEISAATSAVGPVDEPRPRRVVIERQDDAHVVTGGAGRANDSSVQLRGRSTRAASARGSGGKED